MSLLSKVQENVTLSKTTVEELLSEENLLSFNREINLEHAKKMENSIKTLGVLRLPVLAKLKYQDDDLAIADMQHGLYGWNKLATKKDTIDAIVVDCKTKKDVVNLIAKLNTTSKGWRDINYLKTWIEFGIENEQFGNYITLDKVFKRTELPMSLLLDIFAVSKIGFKLGELEFKHQSRSMTISNVCLYFRARGWKSYQLNGLSKFLLKNDLSLKQIEILKMRIVRLEEDNKLPRDRDDLKTLLALVNSETANTFNDRFDN
jgi:hypothetical protein